MWLFLACLLLLTAAGRLLENERMLGTAIVLLANWTLNTVIATLTNDPYPWAWFLATDYLSGFVLVALAGRPSMWQVVVTVLFAFECIVHGAFGLSRRTPWTEYYYWHTLSYVAWSQFWVVTGWGLCDLASRISWPVRRAPSSVARVDRDRSNPEP